MGLDIQWPLVLLTMVAGVGGGMLVPAGVVQLAGKQNVKTQFTAMVTCLVLLVVGGCFSLLHLASPQNVMAAVFNIFSFSGISMELILLGMNFVIAAVFAVLLKREVPPAAYKVVAVLGIVFAVLLLFFCGHGYIMLSRPAWDTDMLPLAYLGTSLAGGAFAYGVVMAACKADVGGYGPCKAVMLICSLLCAATCASYGFAVADVAAEQTPVVFWGGMVVCGIVLMLVAGVLAYVRLAPPNALAISAVALVVALVAILAVRVVMWDTSAGYLELFNMAAAASHVVP